MSLICYKPSGSCYSCSHYRNEDGRLCCFAKQDEAKLKDLILRTYQEAYEEDNVPDDFHLWLSYLMSFGFTESEILEFAKVHNIEVGSECDPDDPDDHYGCLCLNIMSVARLAMDK